MNPFGHHHHHHSQAVYPPPAVQGPAVQGEIVKIYCEANPDYNLAHCDGDVKMAVANESDPNQQWIMDTSWGVKSKDSAGFPAFALINRATGQAIRHSRTVDEKISLGPYHPDDLNEAVLFTQSADVGNGYQCIRPVYDISLNLDAAPDKSYHKNHSVNISEGAEVSLTKWTKKESQKWRITPILAASQARMLGEGNHAVQGAVVKIHCEANPEFFVSARDRVAVLALEDKYDPHQQWVKVDSWGIKIKDEVGYPAFALVNKATGLALKHGQKEWDQVKFHLILL
eukprot:TRINITY_DN3099_c0_g1_i4.p1 TRINITY_DN3099_c0_g1~~TRINITY_DN3099_c0_g1_i4.p1  ORF type:complete len:285 (+),score=-0.51 TRINITY_DN3099_c0_g1_i4:161-1015(+)